jgi:DNA-binding response OmpR family regulator
MKAQILLLVEDEVLIQEMLDTEFTEAGFEVAAVSSGTQALAELNADATRFKAIVTDIRLGAGPKGWDVADRARELVATMPIVYISGDSAHEWASKGVSNSVMVSKPFTPAQIITAVSTLLNHAQPM